MLKGKVIKAVGGIFYLSHKGQVFPSAVRKKIRYNNVDLLVGDNVFFKFDEYGKVVIESAEKRKNQLSRPPIANIDVAVIVISCIPKPDFYLVDKIVINCYIQNIRPVLVINKADLVDEEFEKRVREEYGEMAETVLTVSAEKEINLDLLKEQILGKTCVFCGQSAVGKTSLLNKLNDSDQKVGAVSLKTGRGKHTTRHSQIFEIQKDTFVVDTPGFSLLDLKNVKSSELNLYYTDMTTLQAKCRYHMCTHTTEPDCEVKKAVEEGRFNKNRYERYLTIYEEIKQAEKNKF